MSLLFEDLFKRMNYELKQNADMNISKFKIKEIPFDIVRQISSSTITVGLENAIATVTFSNLLLFLFAYFTTS